MQKDKICKSCVLFDPNNSICSVVFIINGEDHFITTNANDTCHLLKHDIIRDVKVLKQDKNKV